MVKHTQTIRQQIADELFECVCESFFFKLSLKKRVGIFRRFFLIKIKRLIKFFIRFKPKTENMATKILLQNYSKLVFM